MPERQKTFDRQIEKEVIQARKSLKKLGNVFFACEADARAAADRRMLENHQFLLKNVRTCMISRRVDAKRGRPKKGEALDVGYLVDAEVERNEQIITSERAMLGRFVLASNDIIMDGELILQYYKGQNAVEKGFRFLKDKSFRVAEVYLKKDERIEALDMIMVQSLLIYSIAEWTLRKRLKEKGETVLNQLGKPAQTPALKWVFQKFRNINVAVIELMDSVHREIININEEQKKIIKLFGQGCEKYYN
jgi:transposase